MSRPPQLSALSPMRIPSYLLSGLNVAFGLLLVSMLAYVLGGFPWATGASIGAVITSMPDLPARPNQKVKELLPATLLGAALYLVSLLSHPEPWLLAATIMVGSFLAVLPQAWGKRGAPLSFSMMFGLVLPLAAPPITHYSFAFLETALFIGGGLAYIAWSQQSARWLDTRYRTLALADACEAMTRMLRLQARAIGEGVAPRTAPDETLGALVLEQTAWTDRLQTARDLVFFTLDKPRHRQLAAVLLILIEVRDQLLTSQLDIDLLMRSRAGRDAVPALAALLEQAADAVDVVARTLRDGKPPEGGWTGALTRFARRIPEAHHKAYQAAIASVGLGRRAAANDDPATQPAPLAAESPAAGQSRWDPTAGGASGSLVEGVLRDRLQLLLAAAQDMSAALADRTRTPPLSEAELQLFVSPTTWTWKHLRERLVWRSPVLRFGLRTALAMGAAYAIALALPWASHKHWILVSVAVVLRSTYAQSSERRRLRLIGTALGCLLSASLLGVTENRAVLFLVLVASAGVGHAFAAVRYAVTASAGSVMGLVQTHLLVPYGSFVVWERLLDTLLGIALAWAFSFVLPSWERHQIPALLKRVLQSQARHAQLTLAEFKTPSALSVDWRLARREVYDAMAALVQGVQRMQAEPKQVRLPVPAVAALVKHGQELMAHMAAVKTLITLRRDNLDVAAAADAVARAGVELEAVLNAPVVVDRVGPPSPRAPVSKLPQPDWPLLPPPDQGDLTPWLQRRLTMAQEEARLLVSASRPILKAVEEKPAA